MSELNIGTWTELLQLYRAVLPHEARSIYNEQEPNQEGILPAHTRDSSAQRHAAWMLENMPLTGQYHLPSPTFHRWLGFIQAILWMSGIYSLNQLRDQTRAVKSQQE